MKRIPPIVVDSLIAVGFLWMALSNRADFEALGPGPFSGAEAIARVAAVLDALLEART